ncbi:MAG: secretin N-terminal domain-containing protein [Phycisphaerae bacterium]
MPVTWKLTAMVAIGFVTASLALGQAAAPSLAPSTAAASAPASKPAAPPASASDAVPTPAPVAVAPAPTSAPASAPASKPARTIKLEYANAPYNDVVRSFIQSAVKKPVIGDFNIDGNLTFKDAEPYTYDEAFKMMNLLLSMRGWAMVEHERYVQVVQSKSVLPPIVEGEGAASKYGPGDVVQMVVPVKYISADDAAKAVVRNVSQNGWIMPLPRGKGIVITDRMENIDYIRSMLAILDKENLAEQQLRPRALKQASADSVATTINNLFGPNRPRKMVWDLRQNRFVPDASDSGDFVTAVPDARTNTVFLVGASDKLAMAEKIVEQIDLPTGPEGGDIKIIPVKNARAEEMANTIRQILPPQQQFFPGGQPSRGGGRQFQPTRVVADNATNSIIVSGPKEQMDAVEKLIADMDKETKPAGGAKIIRLAFADAQQIAPIVERIGRGTQDPRRQGAGLAVSADSRTNTLIVSGSAGDVETAAKLVEELDREDTQKPALEIRFIQLKAGDARQVADSLRRLFEQQQQQRGFGPRGGGSAQSSGARFEAEPTTNSLMIAAGPADWPIIEKLLKNIEEAVGPTTVATTKIVPIKNAKASDLAATLRGVYRQQGQQGGQFGRNRFGQPDQQPSTLPPVIITASDRTNVLVISASETDHKALEALIAQLDVPLAEGPVTFDPVIIVRLKSADAAKLADTLRNSLPRGPQEVSIQPDPTNSMLLIRGPEAQRKMIEKLIADLDEETKASARAMQVVKLKGASASALSSMLTQLYQNAAVAQPQGRFNRWQQPQAQDRAADSVVIVPAPDDKTLVIDAPEAKMKAIISLAESLDAEYVPTRLEVRIFQLKGANAGDVAPQLSRLFAQRYQPQPGVRTAPDEPAPRFEADTASNRILAAATMKQFETVEKLIHEIDIDVQPGGGTQIVKLKNADAQALAGVLGAMSQRSSRGGRNAQPLIATADVRTNSLVLSGMAGDINDAKALIEKLDVPTDTPADKIEIITLENTDASRLLSTLQGMLPPPQRGQAQDIYISAEAMTNSILLRAPEAQRKMVKDMIASLDKKIIEEGARSMQIKKLKSASASALAQMLAQFYQTAAPVQRSRFGPPQPAAPAADAIVITAAPDDRTLLVEAPKRKIDDVLALIDDLDGEAVITRAVKIYDLANANANDLVGTLRNMFAEDARRPGVSQATVEPAPRIEADSANNRLLVAGTAKQIVAIEGLIKDLDKAAPNATGGAQIVKLRNADAGTLAALVQNAGARRGPRGELLPGLTVSAETRTNSLLVAGNAGDVANALKLIEKMDVKSDESEIQIVHIKTVDAARLAQTLQAMVPPPQGNKPQEVFITADPTNTALLIRAPQSQRKTIEQLIAQIDAGDVVRETRLVRLKGASAAALAGMMQQLYQSAAPVQGRRPGPAQQQAPDAIIITAAPDDRTLVIDAPRKRMDEIAKMAADLDLEISPTAVQLRTYQLTTAVASEMAASLSRLFAEKQRMAGQTVSVMEIPPRFEADSATNQLIVAANAKQFETIEKLIKELNDQTKIATQTRTMRLKFARASDVVGVLQSMLAEADRPGQRAAAQTAVTRVAAMADGNAVIVQGMADKIALAEQIIKELDRDDLSSASVIQIVQLKNAQAATLADAVNKTLAGQAGSPLKRATEAIDQVTVTAEPNSNSVLVRGPKDRIQDVLKMIRDLDNEGVNGTAAVRTYTLKNSDAAEAATTIERFFREIISQGRRQGDVTPFSVAADTRTNTLIVSTSVAHFNVLEALLKKIDEGESAPRPEPQYFWLTNADPTDVAAKLNKMYDGLKGTDKPLIEADTFMNAISVVAKEQYLKEIEANIGKLDVKGYNIRVKVIPLAQVKAEKMAEALKGVYERMSGSAVEISNKVPPRGKDFEDTLPFPSVPTATTEPGVPDLTGGSTSRPTSQPTTIAAEDERPRVVVAVDTTANALIVSGTKQDLENIQSLVDQLSTNFDKEVDLKTFVIKNADVQVVARTLNDLFNPKPTVVPGQQRQPRTPRGGGMPPDQQPIVAPQVVPTGPPVITVVAHIPTKTLFVRAKPMDFDIVEAVIKQLDLPSIVKTEIKVFPLKGTDAAEVATNLRDLFQPSSQTGAARQRGQAGPGAIPQDLRMEMIQRMMEMQGVPTVASSEMTSMVSISSNRITNSVVVSAPTEMMPLIGKVIDELDQSPGIKAKTAVVRMYPLKQASVAPTVAALQQLFSQQQAARMPGGTRGQQAAETPIIITGDEAGRLVLVSAPEDRHELIAKTIKEMDDAQTAAPMTVKVYHVQFADVNILAGALMTAIGDSAGTAGPGPRRTPGGGGTGMVRISADASTSSLVVRAGKEDHDRIEKILKDVDKAPGSQYEPQTIPLTNADAANVAAILNRMFAGNQPAAGGPRRTGLQAAVQQIQIEGDKDSRLLIVRADDETFKKIRQVVAQLDAAPPAGAAAPTVIPLKHAEAVSVAAVLQQAFPAQAARGGTRGQTPGADDAVTIVGAPFSNSLIVTASAKKLKQVMELVDKIDTDDTTTLGFRTEIVTLKNAKAADLAAALSKTGAGQAARGGTRAPAAGGQQSLTVASVDASNSLIISGPGVEVEKTVKIAMDLDNKAIPGLVSTKLFALKNAQAATVAPAIQQAFAVPKTGRPATPEDIVIAVAESNANAVLVTASASNMTKIEALIKEMEEGDIGGVKTEIILLKNAKANDVAAALSKVIQTVPRGAQRGGNQQGVSISAEPTANAMIVSGPAQDLEKIKKVIDEIEKATIGPAQDTKVIALKNAQAQQVAAALQQAFTPKGKTTLGPEDQVTVAADPSSSTIVVTASAANMRKIEDLVKQMDSSSAGAKTEVLALKNAKAVDLANALKTVAASIPQGPKAGGQGQLAVSGDANSNSLIIAGQAADVEKLLAMARQLDEAGGAGQPNVHLIQLRNGVASQVAATVKDLYRQVTAGKPSSESMGVTADDRANVLVVAASDDTFKKISEWVDQVEQMAPARGSLRIISLNYADPNEVNNAIQQQFNGVTGGVQTSPRPGTGTVTPGGGTRTGPGAGGARPPSGGTAPPRRPAPGPSGSTGAPTTEAVVPGELADVPDASPKNDPVYTVTDPAAAADVPATEPAPASQPATKPSGGPSGGKIETTVLPSQRSILVNANDEDFDEIMKLVKAMEEAAKREIKVFTLKNAPNAKVAAALDQMYRQLNAGRQVSPTDQVTVTVLQGTNAVVVAATRDKMAEVSRLIELIDVEGNKLEFRLFALETATPTKILPTLKLLIAQIKANKPDEVINVEADDRTKTVIVSARGEVFSQVEALIKGLDKAPPASVSTTQVLVIPLKHADAARLAAVMMEMLRPDATGQATPEARALQEQVRLLNIRQGLVEKLPDLDLTKPIKITPDAPTGAVQASNSLIISSTEENLKTLRALVEILDVVPIAESAMVRLVHLQNSDAASVLTVLKDIFTQGQTLAGKRGSSTGGKAEPESTSGKGLVNPLNVSADLRTNTLILSGMAETLALAELIVKDLDRVEGKIITEIRLFKLKNADAAKIMPMLTAVFAETPPVVGTEGLKTQVTRLRTVLEKERGNGNTTELPKSRAPLSIQADPSTNILIVAARSDLMPLIADVVEGMDVPGAGSLNAVRFYPLENADATRLQTVITSLYTGPNAQLIRQEDKPTVAVDTRTNALVITASEKTFLIVEAILKKLDAKTPIDLRDIKLVPLKNAESDTLAATLQKMMDARVQRLTALAPKDAEALKVIIVSDPRSNALIVGGSPEGFDLVKSLTEQLDGASPALIGQIQIFPLANGTATTIAPTLTNMFNQRYQAAVTKDVQRQKPVIMADPRTNTLLVAANEDDTKAIKALLLRLDVQITDPAVQIVVIPLKYNDAGTVSTTLKTIFASHQKAITPAGTTPDPAAAVDVTSEPLSNALVISASKDNLELINDLLKKIDIEPPVDSGIVRVFTLERADANATATLLQNLIKQGLYKPGLTAAVNNAAVQAREKVSIVADARTNIMIISASKENMAVIEQMVAKLDSESATLLGDMKIFPLKKADATKLGPMLQQFFTQKRAAELAVNNQLKLMSAVVVADGRTNTLLVTGSKDDLAAADAMISKLDTDEVALVTEFKVFALKNATAATVQPLLVQLFNQRPVRQGMTRDPITVMAEAKSNSLIVGATAEDMKLASDLITKLDVKTDGFAVQVFPLKKADATAVSNVVRSLLSQGAGGAAAAPPGQTVSVDERTNSIIVSAGQADIDRVKELIDKLDQETTTKITEIRVFQLNNADATELAVILNEQLTTKPKAPVAVSPNRQPIIQFITQKEGKDLVSSALIDGVLISADRRTNSLVVSTSVENMPMMEALIKGLDNIAPRGAEIRVFALTNADATQMANVLTQLFRLTGAAATNPKAATYTLVTSQPAKDAPSATLGNAEQAALTVTVDTRTNSLLVGGTKQYVELASKIIQELDACPMQERQTEVYRLRNSRANDVQTALRSFLDQERQRLTTALGASNLGSINRLLEQEVAVVAVPHEGDAASATTLLVSASPRYFAAVEQIIRELDQPPPQVLVQVLLAEVRLDDELDLGMDWMYQKTINGVNVKAGTNFGIATEISKFNGFSVSVTGGDLSFFLRALQTQGRVEVLSRPQILAMDNQKATINIGQRIPLIVDSRVTDTGQTINTIQYNNVGVILNLTPRINPDGLVRMDVNPEISQLSNSTIEISPGVKASIIDQRIAQTTITVQDGHTVVLGGLIITKDDNQEDKVPVLGDVPLLGLLFKKTVKVKQRAELLIILTPHVMRTMSQGDAQTRSQVDRLNMLHGESIDELERQLFPDRDLPRSPESGGKVRWPATQPAQDSSPAVVPLDLPPAHPKIRRQPASSTGEGQ